MKHTKHAAPRNGDEVQHQFAIAHRQDRYNVSTVESLNNPAPLEAGLPSTRGVSELLTPRRLPVIQDPGSRIKPSRVIARRIDPKVGKCHPKR